MQHTKRAGAKSRLILVQVVKDLEQHTRSLLTQQAAWGVERSRLLALENERRAAIREQEVALRAEMSKLDDKSKEVKYKCVVRCIDAAWR